MPTPTPWCIEEYQRNSTDDFTGSLDWKPVQGTKFTYEQQFTHYKGDSYFTLGPNYLNVQESDGTTVSLLTNYYNLTPYGISSCNTGSMGTAYSAGPPVTYTIFSAPQHRLAPGHQSGMRRGDQLPALAAHARPVPHRSAAHAERDASRTSR